MFGAIPSDSSPAVSFAHLPLPFENARFNTLVHFKPVRTIHEIEIYWCFPSMQDKYRSKPMSYISELLGHEGKERQRQRKGGKRGARGERREREREEGEKKGRR